MRWVIIAIVFYFIGCSFISKNKTTNMEQDNNKFPVEKTDTEWKAILGDFSFLGIIKIKRKKRRNKKLVDKISATLILQSYLEKKTI